ncbi:DUF2628 domain-containing protein [Metabacillus sp. FJAT-52054]|uniref:DUF2628 domain-containing protein n=1 Tax=Metabacillus sediminis TaxID=3117746 RepID=A0ABZ2NL22_9BACI
MFCTKCGTKLRAEDKFCVRCGNAIIREEQPYEPAYNEHAAAVQDMQDRAEAVPMGTIKIPKISMENQTIRNNVKEQNSNIEDHVDQGPIRAQFNESAVRPNAVHKSNSAPFNPNQEVSHESPELAYAGLFTETKSNSHMDSSGNVQSTQPAEIMVNDSRNIVGEDKVRNKTLQIKKTGTESTRFTSHSAVQETVNESHLYVPGNDFTGTGAVQQAHGRPELSKNAGSHPLDPQEAELLRVFAGPNSEYYLSSWKKQYSMNWAAFFLTIFWMGYRKLFAPMVISAGSFILAGLAIAASGMAWLAIIAVPLCMLMIGFFANRIYLSHAKETMDRVLSSQGSWEEKRQLLLSKGGTNWTGVLIAAGIIIAYLLISILIFSIF